MRLLVALFTSHFSLLTSSAQELEAKININHSKVQGTDASVFENLKQTLEQFINDDEANRMLSRAQRPGWQII